MEYLVKDVMGVNRFCVELSDDDSELCYIKNKDVPCFYGPFDANDIVALEEVCKLLNGLASEVNHLEKEIQFRDKLISVDEMDLARSNVRLSGSVVKARGLHKLSCRVCEEEVKELLCVFPGDEGLVEFNRLKGWG